MTIHVAFWIKTCKWQLREILKNPHFFMSNRGAKIGNCQNKNYDFDERELVVVLFVGRVPSLLSVNKIKQRLGVCCFT